MFKVEAIVNGDQLETLLLAAKAVGVSLLLGVVPDERPSRPSSKRGAKRSTNKLRKPKRYKASMQVRLGPEPKEGPPKLIKLHRALRKHYGDESFRKGEVKTAMKSRFNGTPALMTKLLDQGSMIPA